MDVSTVKTPPVQPARPPKQTQATQQAQKHEAKPSEPEVKKAPEHRPAPVVNTQGQTTGRLLNVTA
jgi:hypothetical protein